MQQQKITKVEISTNGSYGSHTAASGVLRQQFRDDQMRVSYNGLLYSALTRGDWGSNPHMRTKWAMEMQGVFTCPANRKPGQFDSDIVHQ